MQEKITQIEAVLSKLGLNINTGKTQIIRMNNNSHERITVNNHDIEVVTSLTNLGSAINFELYLNPLHRQLEDAKTRQSFCCEVYMK